jgi:hypothetical protein
VLEYPYATNIVELSILEWKRFADSLLILEFGDTDWGYANCLVRNVHAARRQTSAISLLEQITGPTTDIEQRPARCHVEAIQEDGVGLRRPPGVLTSTGMSPIVPGANLFLRGRVHVVSSRVQGLSPGLSKRA